MRTLAILALMLAACIFAIVLNTPSPPTAYREIKKRAATNRIARELIHKTPSPATNRAVVAPNGNAWALTHRDTNVYFPVFGAGTYEIDGSGMVVGFRERGKAVSAWDMNENFTVATGNTNRTLFLASNRVYRITWETAE